MGVEVFKAWRLDADSVCIEKGGVVNMTMLFSGLLSELPAGEKKSIRITVEIVETPLEKLRRAYTEWDKSVNLCDQKSSIIDACGKFDMFLKEFLASAEREGV